MGRLAGLDKQPVAVRLQTNSCAKQTLRMNSGFLCV